MTQIDRWKPLFTPFVRLRYMLLPALFLIGGMGLSILEAEPK